MGAKHLADRRRVQGGHKIDHAGGNTHLVQDLENGHCTQGSGFGRLEHDGAARGQCRRNFSCQHGHRVVPGRYGRDHAHRLPVHQKTLVAAGGRDSLAVYPLGFLGKPEQEIGGIPDLVQRRLQRLALLAGHQFSQLRPARHHPLVGGGKSR